MGQQSPTHAQHESRSTDTPASHGPQVGQDHNLQDGQRPGWVAKEYTEEEWS